MAGRLGTSQAAVSKMEARSDMLLSSVFRYVSALGGEVHLSVRLNEEEFQFVPEDDDGLTFKLHRERTAGNFASNHLRKRRPGA